MRFVAVTTLRDEGAAQVAEEMLRDAGLSVELRRLGTNRYLGAATVAEIEVRVPEDRLKEARAVLDRLEKDNVEAAIAQAGAPAEPGDDAPLPTLEERPKKMSWGIVLSILLPFPAGCLYARAHKLGYTLFGLWIGLFLLSGRVSHGLEAILAVKLLDLVLTPFCVIAWNRRLADKEVTRASA